MGRLYITGDIHGETSKLKALCSEVNSTKDDMVIILGDSGFNYFIGDNSKSIKEAAEKLPITIFCVHGNHEERAHNIQSYKQTTRYGGKVYIEDKFPSLIFAEDGEVYTLPTCNTPLKALVIGGAYSVDKHYRLMKGLNWYDSEQPSDDEMRKIEAEVKSRYSEVDIVITHTCPLRYLPVEWFISGINNEEVDRRMEKWFDSLYENYLSDKHWYCGHYHGDKMIDNMRFMFNTILELK